MQLPANKKIYFLSDFHLGVPDNAGSRSREETVVRFLDSIKDEAAEIFLVGDMFDFWYEYKKVVPKGFVRLLGKLASLSDAGIKLHFFVGNHDMWVRDYFQKELDMQVYLKPEEFEWNNKKFLIGHGDGLGPGDHGYKRLKKIFRNPVSRWLFGIFPPVLGMGLAHYLSNRSRSQAENKEQKFLGEDQEWLIIYSKELLKTKQVNFFVFGHRHIAIDYRLSDSSRYINLGDWMRYYTYAVFDGENMELKKFVENDAQIIRN
ncbi:MAG TPA: UDP-2,3-diacylglucosamine diphosphatase [Chitinophagaceae bacterium]|nr:UDP-2,3-diacylglucosamine diphosphatase [Chitinophagaceae bacterium]